MNDYETTQLKTVLREIADKNGGVLRERDVVAHAKAEQSPLHKHFTWDASEAAEAYWLIQAAQLIRRVKYSIVRPAPDERSVEYTITKAAAFPSLADQRRTAEGSRYPLDVVLSDPDKRNELVRTALGELRALQRKYESLVELSAVWEAIASLDVDNGRAR